MRKLLILGIRGYQAVLSPLLGGHCRFYPTCSEYWIGAIEKYGCLKGLWLGSRRLVKCHPLHPGGVDLVP